MVACYHFYHNQTVRFYHKVPQLMNTKSMKQPLKPLIMFNTLRPRQNGRHFADDTFKRIFVNENVRVLIGISLKFVPKGPIDNIPALAQIMAWRRPGDKPLPEPMMVCLPTHICVIRPQWVIQPYWNVQYIHSYMHSIWVCLFCCGGVIIMVLSSLSLWHFVTDFHPST